MHRELARRVPQHLIVLGRAGIGSWRVLWSLIASLDRPTGNRFAVAVNCGCQLGFARILPTNFLAKSVRFVALLLVGGAGFEPATPGL
jgi:hypothetical protein